MESIDQLPTAAAAPAAQQQLEDIPFDCFVAIRVPGNTGCHITVCMAKGVTGATADAMKQAWYSLALESNGMTVEVGNFCRMGSDGQIPAYKCRITDAHYQACYRQFYRKFYVPSDAALDRRLYPDLKLHITVDTPERVAEVESIIRDQQTGGTFQFNCHRDSICEVRNRQVDEERAVVDSTAWVCVKCGNRNPLFIKTCVGRSSVNGDACTQWRPIKAMPAIQSTLPDPGAILPLRSTSKLGSEWSCDQCKLSNFATRSQCRACLAPRRLRDESNDHRPRIVDAAYEEPPSAPPAASMPEACPGCGDPHVRHTDWHCPGRKPVPRPAAAAAAGHKVHHPDWKCPGCGDPKQFGSRTTCRQCGYPRP